jgi:3-oxoacyl-[acyl-carrier-protein] synthase II
MSRRVVVTGLGVVTPVGVGLDESWQALLGGESGFRPVESFDTSRHKVHVGAEVQDFRPEEHLVTLDAAELGRASQLAVAAARMAFGDAGLDPAELDPRHSGVAMGTTSGEPCEVEKLTDRLIAGEAGRVGGEFISRYPCHRISEHVASELGFAGPNIMIPTACAAGNYAIGHAFDLLRLGRAELMLAGGADCFSRITYTGFARLGAIAPERVQPFDVDRQGMIPGEGAGVLVLEPLERARQRGARIYAEVAGCGLSCDAHHMTGAHPEGDGAARAMEQALRQSGLAPADVTYISAHGTGTPTNDRIETIAVKRVFSDAAYGIPMSSIKSMIGHTMGAASAIEAAVCAMAIATGRIPPTMNLVEPDPVCDLDYVANQSREHEVAVAMSNAYAFGGNNASLMLKRAEP